MQIVLDVWAGEYGCEHVARYLRPLADAIKLAERELAAGFLVNMRAEAAWGPDFEFDARTVN